MKNLNQYTYTITNEIFIFLNIRQDYNKLINKLVEIELKLQEDEDDIHKGLWFKFGEDDTLCTTIDDIKRDLMLSSWHPNYKFLMERFVLVSGDIEPKHEILIYFS